MELVVKLHEYCTVNRMDYCIRYATDAICWTQAPERLSDPEKAAQALAPGAVPKYDEAPRNPV